MCVVFARSPNGIGTTKQSYALEIASLSLAMRSKRFSDANVRCRQNQRLFLMRFGTPPALPEVSAVLRKLQRRAPQPNVGFACYMTA